MASVVVHRRAAWLSTVHRVVVAWRRRSGGPPYGLPVSDDETLVRQRLARLSLRAPGVLDPAPPHPERQPSPIGGPLPSGPSGDPSAPRWFDGSAGSGRSTALGEEGVPAKPSLGPPQGWPGAAEPTGATEPTGAVEGPTRSAPSGLADPFAGADESLRARLLGGSGPFDPGRTGVKALAAVAAVVVLAAAFFAYRARPTVEPLSGSSAAPAPPPPAQASPQEVVVAVSGRVRKPGLVRLPAGARVADAVDAAGGALPGTDLTPVNLARRVVDGEQILVGLTPPPGVAPAATASGPAAKVNLNTATVQELDALPGIGPVLAQRIVDHRERNGGFKAIGELRSVDGFGAARYDELKDLVTI
jgi:competence protein ComEA